MDSTGFRAILCHDHSLASTAPTVVDVRSEKEWAGEHIAGSLNLPLNHLRDRATEVAKDRPVVVHCEGG